MPGMPVLACPMGCECVQCGAYGPIRDAFQSSSPSSSGSSPKRRQTVIRGPLKGHNAWLRISDDRVEECSLERVLSEGGGAFLLFYERVQSGLLSASGIGYGRALGKVYANGGYTRGTPRSSEETVRPDEVGMSVDSLVEHVHQAPILVPRPTPPLSIVRPRVVRRTTAGRRTRAVVPSGAISLGSGLAAADSTSEEGDVGLEMATSAPELRNLTSQVAAEVAEERMVMSEVADEGQMRFHSLRFGEEGSERGEQASDSVVLCGSTVADAPTSDSQSFREDKLNVSQASSSPFTPSSNPHASSDQLTSSSRPASMLHSNHILPLSPPPSPSPRPSSPSSFTSPPVTNSRQRKPKSQASHSRGHAHAHTHAHSAATPLGLRA